MKNKIVVGFDGSAQAADALTFSQLLQSSLQAELVVAAVVPFEMFNARVGEHVSERELAQKIFSQADELLTDSTAVQKVAIADISPARGLYHFAEDEHVNMLIIGSTHRGPIGRILPGGDGDRLLTHAPCAVTMVPHTYQQQVGQSIKTVGVAFNGSTESASALRAATTFAQLAGAKLRLIMIHESLHHLRFR